MQQGYKQTEIGVIPEDWNLMPSGEFIEVLTDFTANGSFASLAENVTYLDYPDYARLVRLTDIRTNFKNQGIYVSKDSYDFLAKSSLFGGELLLANVGAYAGYSFLFQKNFQEYATLGPNMFLIKANKNILREEYVPLVFGYGSVFKQLIDAAASSAQPKINKDNVRKSVAIIPPLDEQEHIVEALSDVDGMVSSLDKLIAKKKAVKQGAMQELLTGKKRLPGFTGEWDDYTIGKMGEFYSGLSGKSKKDFDCGEAYYITFLNVLSNVKIDTSLLASVDVRENESQNAVRKGDLFFNTSSETPEEVGMCAVLDEELENTYLNSFCFGFRLFDDTHDPLFLSYYLNSAIGRKIMSVLAQGATRYNLSKNNFAETVIKLPVKEEQTAIASILSDMDNEIEALEQKLTKARQIKQGMMQQLLTGKIRLV